MTGLPSRDRGREATGRAVPFAAGRSGGPRGGRSLFASVGIGGLLTLLTAPLVATAVPYPDQPASAPPSGSILRTPGDDHRDDDPRYFWYDLLHVEMHLALDPATRLIDGEVSFDVRSRLDRCPEILLDLVDSLAVTAVTRDGRSVAFEHQHRLLRLLPDRPLRLEEEARFTVSYGGHPPRDGPLGLAFEVQGDPPQPLISTLSETHSAAGWWPCKNITWDKFTVDAFFTVPESLTAVSNGVLVGVRPGPAGTREFHWHEGYPICTYLVSLAATNYVHWSDTYYAADSSLVVPVDYFAYPASETPARAAWARTPEMISLFASRFGEYPFPRDKYALVEFNWGGAMENQTCTSYGTYNLSSSVADNERVMAHELAHQWWGDLVSPATWDDMWLNEGFAVYGEALWAEHVGGRAGYSAYMTDIALHTFDGPVYPPNYTFSATVYFKGAWVLHLLRGVLGDSTFFRTLAEYRRDYAQGPASTQGLETVCERTSGRDLQDFFASWVYGTGKPVYEAAWTWSSSGDLSSGTVELDLRQIQKEPVFSMPLPLVFTFSDAPPETVRIVNTARQEMFTFRFDRCPADLQVDPENWVLKRVYWIQGPTGVENPPLAAADHPELIVVPNPSSGPVEIRLLDAREGTPSLLAARIDAQDGPGLDGTADRRFSIFDAAGRRIRRLAGPDFTGGTGAVAWDGHRDDGRTAAVGVYWVVAEGVPGTPRARLVRVR